MYAAAEEGLRILKENYDISGYSPAIIMMTDGQSNGGGTYTDFEAVYREAGLDIPIFSIMFGDAEEVQLQGLAQLTNARVFDGREDLIGAFRSVKGYN